MSRGSGPVSSRYTWGQCWEECSPQASHWNWRLNPGVRMRLTLVATGIPGLQIDIETIQLNIE